MEKFFRIGVSQCVKNQTPFYDHKLKIKHPATLPAIWSLFSVLHKHPISTHQHELSQTSISQQSLVTTTLAPSLKWVWMAFHESKLLIGNDMYFKMEKYTCTVWPLLIILVKVIEWCHYKKPDSLWWLCASRGQIIPANTWFTFPFKSYYPCCTCLGTQIAPHHSHYKLWVPRKSRKPSGASVSLILPEINEFCSKDKL